LALGGFANRDNTRNHEHALDVVVIFDSHLREASPGQNAGGHGTLHATRDVYRMRGPFWVERCVVQQEPQSREAHTDALGVRAECRLQLSRAFHLYHAWGRGEAAPRLQGASLGGDRAADNWTSESESHCMYRIPDLNGDDLVRVRVRIITIQIHTR
jgi:hypothetical protein